MKQPILALSIDCDGCTVARLHEVLGYWAGTEPTPFGPGLGLPVASSMFVYSRNPKAPPQAAYLDGDQEGLLEACRRGWIDSLHGLGDFSAEHPCTRDLARRAFDALAADGVRLSVWTNHGGPENIQNFLRPGSLGDIPGSPCYLSDLAVDYGIRHVWPSELTPVIGQGRPSSAAEYYDALEGLSTVQRVAAGAAHLLGAEAVRKLGIEPYAGNSLVEQRRLRDGREVRTFRRYGRWRFDTISRLPVILSSRVLDRLVHVGGAMAVYLHIGPSADETPENFRAGLRTLDEVARRFRDKTLGVARTADLLERFGQQ
jgi:hypothetical protein